jgi:hypothetical protein
MKYIKSRSNFLSERKKYNLILEGGLENDINWGDSLLGRLFMSVFRMGSNAINSKRIDGLANSLRNVLSEDVRNSITDENPELEEEINKLNRRLVILSNTQGLLQVLKTANIQQIQLFMEGMSDDNIVEVINKLTNKDKDSIGVLLAIQEWTKKEEKEEEEGGEEGEEEDDESGSDNSTIDEELINKIKTNLNALKSILTESTSNKEEYKKGDTVINKDSREKITIVSSETKDEPGPDSKLGTNDDIKGTEKLNPDEVYGTDDGVKGLVIKKKNIKKESFIIESIFMLLELNSITELDLDSVKGLRKGFKFKDTSEIKKGADIYINSGLIDKIISSDKKILSNIYSIINKYINKGNTDNPDEMYDKLISENPDNNDISRTWLECYVARKVANVYSELCKLDLKGYDNEDEVGKKITEFMESMEDVLSEINNKKIEYISEAVLSDFFLKESGKKIK